MEYGLAGHLKLIIIESLDHYSRAKLGRFPICFKLWKLCLQYWLRLKNGTDNIILNQAYQYTKEENHCWYQSIKLY